MLVRNTLAGAVAAAAIAFAGPALAAATSTGTVGVDVTIEPTVSIWGANAALDLNGANPQDSAAVASTISYINNVDANVQASVAGIPGASAGEGIQFSIFNGTADTGAALSAIAANQYTPAGAITFNSSNQATPQTLESAIGVNSHVHNEPVVYAASLPGNLPAPGTTSLTVTYTITQNP